MSRLAAKAKMQFYPTKEEILEYITMMINSTGFGRVLDPCAGEGDALHYLVNRWYVSAFAIEPNEERYKKCLSKFGRSNTLNEFFEDVKAKNFELVFVNPPYDNRKEISWLRMVANSMKDDGMAIWILPQSTVKNEKFIETFSSLFYDAEVWKYPDKLFDEYKQYVIRARLRKIADVAPSLQRSQDFAKEIEEYKTLGVHHIHPWVNKSTDRSYGKMVRKDLAWEDVFIDVMDSWKRIPYIKSKLLHDYLKAVERNPNDDNSVGPDYVLHDDHVSRAYWAQKCDRGNRGSTQKRQDGQVQKRKIRYSCQVSWRRLFIQRELLALNNTIAYRPFPLCVDSQKCNARSSENMSLRHDIRE